MTGINMKVPPPVVTGASIPGNLHVKTALEIHNENKLKRKQASDEVALQCKKYAKKDKHSTPLGIKILGGIMLALAAFCGIKGLKK